MLRLEFEDLLHGIDQGPNNGVFLPLRGNFYHHDARVDRLLRPGDGEFQPHVENGYHAAPQVDDASHVVGCLRYPGYLGKLQYLPHVGNIKGKDLVARPEGEIRPRVGNRWHAHRYPSF